jgi:hypothetical protein
MGRRPWGYLRTLSFVGVAAALLFGDLSGARAETPEDPAAERAVGPTAAPTAASRTVTFAPAPVASGDIPAYAMLPGITCRITVTTPTDGALHVFTSGEVRCNYPISEIGLYVELSKNGRVERYNEGVRVDSAGFSLITEAPCSGGTWQAFAWGSLLAPPGYVPQHGNVRKTSPAVVLNINADCDSVPPSTTTTRPRPPPTLPPCPPSLPNCQEP